MKNANKIIGAGTALFMLTLLACVTINIYFPAEKVETVAQDIVDDIRSREEGSDAGGEAGEKQSLFQMIRTCLSPGAAWADEVTEVSNATIRALKERMKRRYQQMKPFYDQGLLKEGNNGYVSAGDLGSLGLREKRDLNSLVEAENQDRRALYQEVARALKIDPSQVDRIAGIFAKEWQK
jgi:uncharacterized protein